MADKFADVAAGKAQLLMGTISWVLKKLSLVKRIQARIAAVVISLPHRTKQAKPFKERTRPYSWMDLLDHTDHTISMDGTQLWCAVCMQTATNPSAKREILSQWCPGPQGHLSSHKVVKMPSQVRVNKLITHCSHALSSYRGVMFCTECGSLATVKLNNLHRQCPARAGATSHGVQCINRLSKGIRPNGVDYWPHDIGAIEPLQAAVDAAVSSFQESEALSSVQSQVECIAINLSARLEVEQRP